MTEQAARTIVIGNWDPPGTYSRKCWADIARRFFDPEAAPASPWASARKYFSETEGLPTFLPIPLAAPGSESSDKDHFRRELFSYLNRQNVTSLVLVCDSPHARRTLEILGPLSTRPIFVIVASNDKLLSPDVSALGDDNIFRLCPNNRQQAELVVMKMRLAKLRTLFFWTSEKVGSDEHSYHADELRTFLAQSLNIPVPLWQDTVPLDNADAVLFVAGYSATVKQLDRISRPLDEASLVLFSDGCTPLTDLRSATAKREAETTFAIQSSVEPNKIASETVSFLETYADLAPRQLATKVKNLSSLGTLPVNFHGTDNSAIPYNLAPLPGKEK